MSAMSRGTGPSLGAADAARIAGGYAQSVPPGRRLSELSFTGARLESSIRPCSHAIGESGMSLAALRRSTPVALAVATALGLGAARTDAESPLPDTSDWKCSQCPFLQG